MSNPNDPAAEPAAITPSPAAVIPAAQPVDWESDLNPWKKRSAGWQAEKDKAAAKLTDAQLELTRLASANLTTGSEKNALASQLEEITKQHTDVSGKYGEAATKLARLEVLLDYPELLPLEKKGLLPAGAGDELKAKLDAFRAEVGAMGKQATVAALQGATPPAPAGAIPRSPEELMKAALAALKDGNKKEYDDLSNQYYAALAAKK